MEASQVKLSAFGPRSLEKRSFNEEISGSFSLSQKQAPVRRHPQVLNANSAPFAGGIASGETQGFQTQAMLQQSRPHPLMSTIGFGIDSSEASSHNATEAAVRALRDAMERSTYHVAGDSRSPLQIHVKLGVPAREDGSTEPMNVDTRIVSSLLPRSIPVLPIEIVVGGLSTSGLEAADPSLCSVVACISILSKPNIPAVQPVNMPLPVLQQQSLPLTPTAVPPMKNPVNSMDMLALISAQMRERHVSADTNLSDVSNLSMPTSVPEKIPEFREQSPSISPDTLRQKKKLPPGTTAKNNIRHFAQHNYHDHSVEALPEEELPVFGSKLQMSAFPVKLHEALSHIEADGHGDVIGWMPHGRSFKIFKQQEFLDEILPKYFVMTKKSSFLRQLNLYGFNRISSGPDKNSYYHELFLRGMRFLSQRINRTKVNGNVIRSAADPATEPCFYKMPPVPRSFALSEVSFHISQVHPPSYPVSRDNSEEETTVEREDVDEEDEQFDEDELAAHRINNQISFPLKLQRMLDKLEAEDHRHIISWQPHGRAFRVHDPDAFVRELMPLYFRQSKYPSFQRQLHLYSFQRISSGKDKGAYYHEKCLRGMPGLCDYIRRTRINGKGCRKPSNPLEEPNFYELDFLQPIPPGAMIDVPTPEGEGALY